MGTPMEIYVGPVTFQEEAEGNISRGHLETSEVRIVRLKTKATKDQNHLRTICRLTKDEPGVSSQIGSSCREDDVYFVFEGGLTLGDLVRAKGGRLTHDELKRIFSELREVAEKLEKLGVGFSSLEEDDITIGSNLRARISAVEKLKVSRGLLQQSLEALAALFQKIPVSGIGELNLLYNDLCVRLTKSGKNCLFDPYFWTTDRVLEFLSNVSEVMKNNEALMIDFDTSHKGQVFQTTSWTAGIKNQAIRKILSGSIVSPHVIGVNRCLLISQRVERVSFLVRAIRNLSAHFINYKGKSPIMHNKETFRNFVSLRWPRLLSFTYSYAQSDRRLSHLV